MPTVARRIAAVIFLLVLSLPWQALAAPPVSPSSPATAPASNAEAAPSAADLQRLEQLLNDPAARDRLLHTIKTLIAADQAGTHAAAGQPPALGDALVALLSAQLARMAHTVAVVTDPAAIASAALSVERSFADPTLRMVWLHALAAIAATLALAIIAERVTARALAGLRRRLRVQATASLPFRTAGLVAAILLQWLPLLAFLIVGYAVTAIILAAVGAEPAAGIVAAGLVQARVLTGAILVPINAVLVPPPERAGLLPIDPETANYWNIWLTRLVRFAVAGRYAIIIAAGLGVAPAAAGVAARLLALVFAGLLVMLVLQNRSGVAQLIRGHGTAVGALASLQGLRGFVAEIWPFVAVLYIMGGYGVWATGVSGGLDFLVRATTLSAVIVAVTRLVAIGGTRLARRMLMVLPDVARRFPDLQPRVNRYTPVLIGTGRALLYTVAAILILQAWGLDVLAWLTSPIGRGLVGGLAVIALSAAAAVATWEFVGMALQLYLQRPGADGTPAEQSARTRTLLPLFRRTLAILLGAAVVLVVLSEFNVNVAPLLAGAGIAGIAIGFGAQTMVKDIITGLFILMQDAISVGDVVTVAGNSGLVEEISIRSIRLRDLSGTVIVVPFSEVSTVRNMTKDFSFAVFDISIAYKEDVEQVIGILGEIGEELRASEQHGWRILEPIEIYGLDRFGDSAIVVKARIKTRPIQQWTVMRAFNLLVKKRFDALGIEIPFPHQTIYFGADKNGEAPPMRVVTERPSQPRPEEFEALVGR